MNSSIISIYSLIIMNIGCAWNRKYWTQTGLIFCFATPSMQCDKNYYDSLRFHTISSIFQWQQIQLKNYYSAWVCIYHSCNSNSVARNDLYIIIIICKCYYSGLKHTTKIDAHNTPSCRFVTCEMWPNGINNSFTFILFLLPIFKWRALSRIFSISVKRIQLLIVHSDGENRIFFCCSFPNDRIRMYF